MKKKASSELIKQAWAVRYSGDISRTEQLIGDLENGDDKTPLVLCEILLLKASIALRQRNAARVQACFKEAEDLLSAANVALPSRFFMQKGLWLDSLSEFTKSLPQHLEAVRRAETPVDRLVAQMNVVVCLYNLSLPLDKAFNDLHALRKTVRGHPYPALERHVRLIEQKEAFLKGDLAGVFGSPQKEPGQALFHQAWVARLPWAPKKKSIVDRFIETSFSNEAIYQNEYRRQTVLADPRWTDEGDPRAQDQVDRLYLWTWLWLEDPESPVRDLLASELSQFPFEKVATSLTTEDFLMLRSMGGWLGLWNANFRRWFQAWIRKATPSDIITPPLFEIEERLQACLRDHADGNSTSLKKVVADLRKKNPELAGLADLTEKLAKDLGAAESRASLFVDRARSVLKTDGRDTISKPMVEILAALKEDGYLSFEDALERGFEIAPYDDFVHDPKIHNLVQRLKTLLPASCILKTKDGVLHFKDPKNEIAIVAGSRHEAHFPGEVRAPLPKKQTEQTRLKQTVKGPAQLLVKFAGADAITREQIQDAIGTSKATTNRWIQTWLKSGVLTQTGSGRATRYRLRK